MKVTVNFDLLPIRCRLFSMGLREKKALRSRDRIISEAMALFAARGYEQTTMEVIAEAADVSPSTLYRYFPSKDSIVMSSFMGNTARFAEVFALCVKEMPPERAVAEAIFAVLAVEDKEPQQALLVRSILGQSPAARARLWDYMGEQRGLLTQQLAASLGRKEDDPICLLSARIAVDLLLTAADMWREGKGKVGSRATAETLMTLLRGGNILFPDPGTTSGSTHARPASQARKSGRRSRS